ncbi:hypothetical protein COMA2_190054 [Candidatus Nitrospira nitrificans]|uniref:Uncharacterized protein n=1 Tax=Candidatus Nitrospira nitrificans TaxID=1742973 RepID=A0A0S4LFW5_9BACT|nr:hypothetical protein COMA2_190054 [Candidatus Nitrospira nitrificans]
MRKERGLSRADRSIGVTKRSNPMGPVRFDFRSSGHYSKHLRQVRSRQSAWAKEDIWGRESGRSAIARAGWLY